jgi:hypothetical protein
MVFLSFKATFAYRHRQYPPSRRRDDIPAGLTPGCSIKYNYILFINERDVTSQSNSVGMFHIDSVQGPLGLVVKRITSITSVCNDKIASSILAEGILFACLN